MIPRIFTGADGLRVSPEREAEIRAAVTAPKPGPCAAKVRDRYGPSAERDCAHDAKPGSIFCGRHGGRK